MINSRILCIAKKLRNNMTEAEKIFWQELRRKNLGVKFYRQFPLVYDSCNFIADFYCAKKKLIIEIDGEVHRDKECKDYDIIREKILKKNGYKILRFSNNEVLYSIKKVIEEIRKNI